MPSMFRTFSRAFRAVDLFPSSKLVRYNGETQYTSTTGGVISMVVIVVFVILFSSMGIRTLRKEIIEASVYTQNEIDPSQVSFTTDKEGGLMFGVFLFGLNLSAAAPRFFDVSLYQEQFSTGYVLTNSSQVPLGQCTMNHFNFNEEVSQIYKKWAISTGLCPPVGHQLSVKGKVTSDIYKQFRMVITRCNSTADPTCVNDTTFAGIEILMGRFQLVMALISTNINAGSQTYRDFYFQDKNQFTFNSQLGISVTANIQEDQIETDQSLMPFKSVMKQNVTHIPDDMRTTYSVRGANSPNAEFMFRKSPKTTTYTRTFNKVDAYLSYVGGLVGTIIGLIFIMGPYTEKTFEVSLARKLMVNNEKEQIDSKSFNILFFLSMYLRKLLEWMKVKVDWPTTKEFTEISEEVCMQIDITYMAKKLMFLDSAIAKLLQKHQIEAICLRAKPTIESAKDQRRMHFATELFKLKDNQIDHHHFPLPESISPKHFVPQQRTPSVATFQISKKKQETDEDVSAMAFSRKSLELEGLKSSVARVVKQKKLGRSKSIKIFQDLNPATLKQLGVIGQQPKKLREKKTVSIAAVEHIDYMESDFQEQSYKTLKASRFKMEKNGE